MKKFILFSLALSFSSYSMSEGVKFVNADDSKHSDICIAAADSKMALKEKAKQFNYSKEQIERFTCNGMPIDDFADKYRASKKGGSGGTVNVFSFDNSVGSIEAELCIAAANSNKSFNDLKSTMSKLDTYFESITCNGVPLERFARKYGNKKFRL